MSASLEPEREGDAPLPFAGHLLRLAHLQAQRAYARSFADLPVTSLQAAIITTLLRVPDMGHDALAGRIGATKTVLTTAMKPLLAQGQVARAPRPGDGRRAAYALTPASEALAREVWSRLEQADADLLHALDPGEERHFRATLTRVLTP